MGERIKTGGRDWVKGQSGNPHGRPKISKEYRELMELNREIVAEIFSRYMMFNLDELVQKKKDKSIPMIERMVISMMVNIEKKGDKYAFDFLLDRAIGKVKDNGIIAKGDIVITIDSDDESL